MRITGMGRQDYCVSTFCQNLKVWQAITVEAAIIFHMNEHSGERFWSNQWGHEVITWGIIFRIKIIHDLNLSRVLSDNPPYTSSTSFRLDIQSFRSLTYIPHFAQPMTKSQ